MRTAVRVVHAHADAHLSAHYEHYELNIIVSFI